MAPEYTTPEVKWHGGLLGTVEGLANVTETLRGFIGALPDFVAAEQDVVAADDSVAVRSGVEATHQGIFSGSRVGRSQGWFRPLRWPGAPVSRIWPIGT